MSRTKTTARLTAKLEQLEKIKADISKIEQREAARIGKIVMKSGLLDSNISDSELEQELAAIAAKFSAKKKPGTQEAGG